MKTGGSGPLARGSARLVFFMAFLAACLAPKPPRITAPLSYAPLPPPPDEPFRITPPEMTPLELGPMFGMAKSRLPNGMEVILIERHGLPVLSARLVIQRGARDLPGRRPELLQLAMDALVREHRSSPDASPDVRPDAGCGPDGCALSIDCLSGSMETAMRVLADLALRPRYSSWHEARVRDEWKSWVSRKRGSAGSIVDNNARALLFVRNDSYAPIAEESVRAIDGATVAEVRQVHEQLFQPEHATLVVAGDVTLDALRAAAERAFGGWKTTRPPLTMTAAAPPIPAPTARTVLVDYPGELVHAYVVARAPAGNEPALEAVYLLATLLGTPQGRLQEQVRATLGAAYDLQLDMRRGRVGSWFRIGGAFEPAKALPAIAAVLQAIRKARDEGVSPADLEGARIRTIAALREDSGTSAGAVSMVASTLVGGAPATSVLTRQSQIAKITAADVQKVAQSWLAEPMLRVVVLGPKAHLVQPFGTLGLGPIEWRGRSGEPLQ